MAELTQNFGLSWKDLNDEGCRLARRFEELARELPPEKRIHELLVHFESRLQANDMLKKTALSNISTASDVQLTEFDLPKRLMDHPLLRSDKPVGVVPSLAAARLAVLF